MEVFTMNISRKMSLAALSLSLLFGCVPHGVAMRRKPEPSKKEKIVAFFKNNSNTFKNALLVGAGCAAGYLFSRYIFKTSNAAMPESIIDSSSNASQFDKALALSKEFAITMSPAIMSGAMGATTVLVQSSIINLLNGISARFAKEAPQVHKAEDIYMNALEAVPEIKELCSLLECKEFDEIKDMLPVGYILHGPIGCGKTEIAKILAHKIGKNFHLIKQEDIVNGANTIAQNLKNKLKSLKANLKEKEAGIVFIESLDNLPLRLRWEEANTQLGEEIVNVLLQEIQGFDSQNKRLIIIVATNRIDMLDKRILNHLKPLEMKLPNYAERKEALKQQLSKLFEETFSDAILDHLAKETKGFSYRALHQLTHSFGRKIFIAQASNPDSVKVLMECLREEKLNVAKRSESAEGSKAPEGMYS